MNNDKPPEKTEGYGRTPYDAAVEILHMLGRAGPYAVFLIIILYAIQQVVIANNDKLEQVNKARTEALQKNNDEIQRLNEVVRANAKDMEALRGQQFDGITKAITLGELVTSQISTNRTTLDKLKDDADKARDQAAKAQQKYDSADSELRVLRHERKALQTQEYKAEETIDAARRILTFLNDDLPPGKDVSDLSRRFETVGPDGMAREADGTTYFGTFRIPGDEMADFLHFVEVTEQEPAIAARLTAAGGVEGAKAGSNNFRLEWQSLDHDRIFDYLQVKWIQERRVQPFLRTLGSALAHGAAEPAPFPADQRSVALQAALFSLVVQDGRSASQAKLAWTGKNLAAESDQALICALYAERNRLDIHRPNASPQTVALLRARYRLELREAQLMLNDNVLGKCPA